jgi:hypothetical protein
MLHRCGHGLDFQKICVRPWNTLQLCISGEGGGENANGETEVKFVAGSTEQRLVPKRSSSIKNSGGANIKYLFVRQKYMRDVTLPQFPTRDTWLAEHIQTVYILQYRRRYRHRDVYTDSCNLWYRRRDSIILKIFKLYPLII